MKLIPVEKDLIDKGYRWSKNQKILQEFLDSGLDCARVDGYHHEDAKSCSGSLRQSVKRFHMNNIDVITHKNQVYLIRKD